MGRTGRISRIDGCIFWIPLNTLNIMAMQQWVTFSFFQSVWRGVIYFPKNLLGWHSRLHFCNSINGVPTLSSQKSRESNTSPAAFTRHHLHALLCESGGGWHLANCVHLFQLLSTVFSGENLSNNTAWQWPEFEKPHSPPTKLTVWIIQIFLMCLVAELYRYFKSGFLGCKLSFGKMIRSSILAALIRNMALLPHVQCSQLSGITEPCGHDFCSVAIFFSSSVFKCRAESGEGWFQIEL